MAPLSSLVLALLFPFFNSYVSAYLVFEEGYTVSTALDGNKLNINPHSILPLFDSSDLIIVDSEHSAFFTVSLTASQEAAVKRISGKGLGFSDGDLTTAMFNKPKSFAVDLNGNIYVADNGNLAIRKISKSGVTTIAGGTKTPGNVDGPGKNASFSTDFELAFIPERCALMICDHGHKLVRQINLKSEDCARGSHSALGSSTWALALGVSCLLSLLIGFAVRPYITSNEGVNPRWFNATWKHYLINQGRQIQTFCFDIRNAVVSSPLHRILVLGLSQFSLTFRIVQSWISHKRSVPLLDSRLLGREEVSEQMKDLMSFDDEVELPESAVIIFEQDDDNGNRNDMLSQGHRRVDSMIHANIMGFEQPGKATTQVELQLVSSSGLVKRR